MQKVREYMKASNHLGEMWESLGSNVALLTFAERVANNA